MVLTPRFSLEQSQVGASIPYPYWQSNPHLRGYGGFSILTLFLPRVPAPRP
jgi:hypothetical protein